MKKHFFSNNFQILTACIISVFLMSYISKQNEETKLTDNFKSPEIEKLVDNVFNDPVYKLIYKKDIQNIIFQTSSQYSINKDKLKKISKKSKLSEDEIKYLLTTVIGFKDLKDFNDYVKSYNYLVKEYRIDKLNKIEQKYFFTALRNKEIKYTGELVELSKNPIKLDSLNKLYSGPGEIRPECWKCVYDYQACLSPTFNTTTVVYPYSNGVIQLSINNGTSWGTYLVTIFNDPFPAQVTYTDPSIQTNQCTIIYQSCISQCNQP